MSVSVYISSEQIQMIGYSGRAAKRFISHPLPEGAMYNGTIIDRALMIESLKAISNDNPGFFKDEVNLIVDSGSILSRRIPTPKLNQKQLMELVRDDFSDSMESTEQIVTGFRVLKTGESAVMGFAVTGEQVFNYITVFTEAGIKLSSIRTGIEAILNFVESNPELQESTIVLNIIDGMTMLSMIFAEGDNVFISRTRLYGDDKDQALGDIINSLNGLMQFANSQQFGTLATSYYVGLSEEELADISAQSQHPDLLIRNLDIYDGPGGTPPPETHFCCLNIQLTGKCVDLLAEYKKTSIIAKKGFDLKKLLLVFPLAVIAVMAVMSIDLLAQVATIDGEIETLQSNINSPDTREKQQEITMMNAEIALLYDVVNQEEIKLEWEAGLIPGSGALLDSILFDHGVEVRVNSLSFTENRTINVSAVCADSTVSTHYVDYLYDSGIADSVSYVGYGSSGDGFGFSISIVLNLPEIEEEEDEVEFETEAEISEEVE